jgi:acyl carrier protein
MTIVSDTAFIELQDIIREVVENPSLQLTPETTAEDVSEWDSFNHLNIVAAVEQRFGIRFRTGEIETLKNVGEFAELIRTKQRR